MRPPRPGWVAYTYMEDTKLYILQCRSGKRTGAGALRIALEMCAEGLVSKSGAVCMVEPR